MRRLRADGRLVAFAGLALAAVGLVALLVTAGLVNDAPDVPAQLSFIASGGVGGLALIGFGLGVTLIQRRRVAEAHARVERAQAADTLAQVLDAIAARRQASKLR